MPLVGMRPLEPEIEEVAAQRLGGQHVERRERLVEQQDIRVDDEGAGEADALPHAAGELLRIGDSKPSRPMRSIAASARSRRSARGTPCASRPSSTLPSTVSQGNSAKLWKTIATPRAGPVQRGWPR